MGSKPTSSQNTNTAQFNTGTQSGNSATTGASGTQQTGGTQQFQQNNTTSTYTPNAQALAAENATLGLAGSVASAPASSFVAPINAQETTGINSVNAAQGVQNPYNSVAQGDLSTANGLVSQGTQNVTPTQFSAAQVQQYESPYISDVVNTTMASLENQNAQQAAGLTGNLVSSGAFGGDRAGIAQAALAGQQDLALDPTIASLYNQNYAQALGEFNTQQQVGLGAQEFNDTSKLQGAQIQGQLGAISLAGGQAASQEALNEAQAQIAAGQLQQQTAQLQAQMPLIQAQEAASIVGGIAPSMGGTTTGAGTSTGIGSAQTSGATQSYGTTAANTNNTSSGYGSGQTQNQGSLLSGLLGAGILGASLIANTGGRIPMAAGGGLGGAAALPPMMSANPAPFQTPQQQMPPGSMPGPFQSAIQSHLQPEMNTVRHDLGSLGFNMPQGGASNLPSGPTAQNAYPFPTGGWLGNIVNGTGHPPGMNGRFGMAEGGVPRAYGELYRRAPDSLPQRVQDAINPNLVGVHGEPDQVTGPNALAGAYDSDNADIAPPSSGLMRYADEASFPSWNPNGERIGMDAGGGIGGAVYTPPPIQPARPEAPAPITAPSLSLSVPMNGLSAFQPSPMQMPQAQTAQMQMPTPAAAPNPMQQVQQLAPAVKAFTNSSLGDKVGDAVQDFGDGLAAASFKRGGGVRRHYDDGGDVEGPFSVDQTQAAGLDLNLPGMGAAATTAPVQVATADATMPVSDAVHAAIIKQESGGNPNAATSVTGATGPGQIEPGTFKQYALPGESIKNPQDNLAVSKRITDDYLQKYNGDPARVAVAYFSGPGNVAPPDSPTPWIKNKSDPNGKTVASYVNDVVGRMGSAASSAANAIGSAIIPSANAQTAPPPGLAPAVPAVPAPNPPPAPVHNASWLDNATGGTGLVTPGGGLTDNARLGLMAAGLGMMAGTSRSPLVNIGAGGLSGLQTMIGANKEGAQVGLTRAQTQGVQTENQIKQQQLNVMMQALKDLQAPAKALAANPPSVPAPSPVAVPGAPAAASAPAAPGVPAPAIPTSAAAQIDPNWDIDLLRQKAQHAAAAGLPALAKQYQDQVDLITRNGMTRDVNGNMVALPGYGETKAGIAGQVTTAETAAKTPFDLVEVQPTPGGPTQYIPKSQLLNYQQKNPGAVPLTPGAGSPPAGGLDQAAQQTPMIAKQPAFIAARQEKMAADEDDMVKAAQVRQTAEQRLGAIQQLMQTYQPGAFAEQKADFVAGARALGIPLGDTTTANPAAFQEFIKNATKNVFDDVKSQGGGRILVSEIQGLTKANANPDLQPAAAAAIINQAKGIMHYENQHFSDYIDWKKANPNATNNLEFERDWMKANPVGKYVDAANKQFAYSGQIVPPEPQRIAGKTYMLPKGQYQWTGTGWVAP